jgi:glutathione synthase/RimK-type ligase-like ATP-grasp enzyme
VTPELFDESGPIGCPVFLEEIRRKSDVRVTLIGPDCFVADIKRATGLVDWRDPKSTVFYSRSTVPATCLALCRTMLSKLGLVYGAFDFLRTPDNDLVFLEVNPTGEWAWHRVDRVEVPGGRGRLWCRHARCAHYFSPWFSE